MGYSRKIVLFELNEVPWQVIDSYVASHPRGALAQLIKTSKAFTTVCEDEIELDPWIAWPTLHRGVTDNVHKILHLGQDMKKADQEYPPIWALLAAAGVRVGVFGSLFSYHVPENIHKYCFFVPDTYADHALVKPDELAPLQQFNLLMTRKSARNVDTTIPVKEALRFLTTYATQGMSLGTVAMVGSHLVTERLQPHVRCRRRSLQPAMLFDVFLKLMRESKPDFATFFTNHVAAAMHRYWAARFPNDVHGNAMSEEWMRTFNGEIDNAMEILDRMTKRLKGFVDTNPEYKLVVVTAIGQAGVRAHHASGFVSVSDMGRFMDRLGLPREAWSEKYAMVPCKSVVVAPEYCDVLEERLLHIKVNGKPMLKSERDLGFSFDRHGDNCFHFSIYMENYNRRSVAKFGNEDVSLEELGFGYIPHQDGVACTGRHTALGSMLVYDQMHPQPSRDRPMISTLEVAPTIIDAFDITAPPYMRQPDPTLLDASIAAPQQVYEATSPERQRQLERVE